MRTDQRRPRADQAELRNRDSLDGQGATFTWGFQGEETSVFGPRLILIEHLLPEGNELSWSKLLDLQMLVLTPGGRERSEAEYAALLTSAELRFSRIIPTAAGVSLIEAVPA